MIYVFYLLIHEKIKKLKDENNLIKRKQILNNLKYQPYLEDYLREIIIKEMCELNLLKKVNRDTLQWIPNKKSENIKDKSRAWRMAKLHERTWWR